MMRILLRVLLSLGLLASACFAQGTFGEGQVLFANPIPGGPGFVAYDYALIGGGPAEGHGPNGFSYNHDTFNLGYKGPGCPKGCTYIGQFTAWYYPQAISKYCTVQSATISGDLDFGSGRVWHAVPAEYSQLVCQDGGDYWYGGGGLTVHNRPDPAQNSQLNYYPQP